MGGGLHVGRAASQVPLSVHPFWPLAQGTHEPSSMHSNRPAAEQMAVKPIQSPVVMFLSRRPYLFQRSPMASMPHDGRYSDSTLVFEGPYLVRPSSTAAASHCGGEGVQVSGARCSPHYFAVRTSFCVVICAQPSGHQGFPQT